MPLTGPNRARAAENDDEAGIKQPQYKRHDDATVAFCRFDGEDQ